MSNPYDEYPDFEAVGPLMDAAFSGRCALDWNHRIRKGDVVTRVQSVENPFLPTPGVACGSCTKVLKRYRAG